MAINLLLKSLKLPTTCVANQKLPKAFFKRNFELTLSEKKLIDDFSIVQQLEIVALINHETANISQGDCILSIYNVTTKTSKEAVISQSNQFGQCPLIEIQKLEVSRAVIDIINSKNPDSQ